ncbi:MFS transporter [soil metagenome]
MAAVAAEPASSDWRIKLLPVVVACPMFLQNLDTSVMATALPTIAQSLNVQVLDLNLAITAYLLSLSIFLPVSGWLADRIGSRRVFCTAIFLFSLGSALCGTAQSLEALVVYRLLQGMGGAMMTPVGRLLLLQNIPPAGLVRAMVWFTVPGGFGRLAGPFFGGAIVTLVSWHWIFLVNVPFGALGIIMALRVIKPDVPTPPEQLHPFDVVGFVLLACGLAGVLGSLEFVARGMLRWPVPLAMGCMGIAALIGYWQHNRREAEPLIDFRILRFTTFRASILGGMPLRIAIGAAPFLLPLMMQIGFGLSPLQSGVLTMATAIGSLFTRTVVGRAIKRMGFRRLLVWSSMLTSLFYMSYGLFTPATSHVLIFCVLVAGGLFNAMVMISLNAMGFTEISRQRMGHATATQSMAQQLALSIGVVLGASLLALTSIARGGDGIHLEAADFMPAFVLVGLMTMTSVRAFRHLPEDEAKPD